MGSQEKSSVRQKKNSKTASAYLDDETAKSTKKVESMIVFLMINDS